MSAKAALKIVVLLDDEIKKASRLLHAWHDLADPRRKADALLPKGDLGAEVSEEEVRAAFAALNASYVALYHAGIVKGAAIVVAHIEDAKIEETCRETEKDGAS